MTPSGFEQDPFLKSDGMEAYERAVQRHGVALLPHAPGPSPAGTESASVPQAPPPSFQERPAREPALTAAPLVRRSDDSIDLAGLRDRARRARALRGADVRGAWIESPEPLMAPDFKLFSVKRRNFTGSWIERMARWMRMLPDDLMPAIDDFGRDAVYEAAAVRVVDVLYRRWLRVRTFGFENVPPEGRALLASNHANWLALDAMMITIAIQLYHPAHREVRALVDRFTAKLPWWSVFLARTGNVLGCPENALRLLERDELILVFPEGARGATKPLRERHHVMRFGEGFARIALVTGAPIIPVAVEGFEDLHPVLHNAKKLAKKIGLPDLPITPTFPWFGLLGLVPPPIKCFIEFGRPIPTDGFKPGAAEDREVVIKLAEKVRFIVQNLREHLRARRKSLVSG